MTEFAAVGLGAVIGFGSRNWCLQFEQFQFLVCVNCAKAVTFHVHEYMKGQGREGDARQWSVYFRLNSKLVCFGRGKRRGSRNGAFRIQFA